MECCLIDASNTIKVDLMKKEAHAIRKAIGWEDSVDVSNILVFLKEVESDDE